jgi:hypothetical protein
MSGVPAAVAHAEDGMMPPLPPVPAGLRMNASTTVRTGGPEGEMHASAAARLEAHEDMRAASGTEMHRPIPPRLEETMQALIAKREQKLASSTAAGHGNATSTAVRLRALAEFSAHLDDLFGSSTPATSAVQLRQMLQNREDALRQLASSTATSSRPLLEHAARVDLAVHALLFAQNLLGSTTAAENIGSIASEIQASLSSTTQAQGQIEGRGFWTRLFWGGDAKAAQVLATHAEQNQERIAQITKLLGEASTSADVSTTLKAQLDALSEEQASLTAQAKAQAGLWGLLSWRF